MQIQYVQLNRCMWPCNNYYRTHLFARLAGLVFLPILYDKLPLTMSVATCKILSMVARKRIRTEMGSRLNAARLITAKEQLLAEEKENAH